MKAEDIIAGEDFQKCVEFHGHLCPGLTMGYKASVAGLEWLKAHRSVDEEIAAFEKRTRDILEKSVDDIFDLKEAQFDPPAKAQIEPSLACSQCGEPTMQSRLVEKDGLRMCRGCSPAFTN
jgi:formylmethanofuran dehydrogenase subunit E